MSEPVVLPSPEIWCRDDIPYLCFHRKLYRCAEIGIDRGVWARLFLSRFPQIHEWWGVDAFEPYPEMDFDRDADYRMALANLQPYSDKAKLIRLPSVKAAQLFGPGSLDFVYIDGAHDYESVRADLAAWWLTLSRKGIIAGHDFDDHPGHEGVKRAVKEFAQEHGLTVYLTAVEGYGRETCPSWYCYVSGMPGPEWRRC